MNYQKAILEALEFPSVGMQFNELLSYLHRRGFIYLGKKTLSKELKRLMDKGSLTSAFLYCPNGQLVKVYTHPLNRQFGYLIFKHDLERLLMQKYRRIQAKLKA